MNTSEQQEWLGLARAWKRGELRPVHPTIGHLLNQALARVGEDCVPFRRATNPSAPSIIDLVRREYVRASEDDSGVPTPDLSGLFARTEQERA